MADEVKLLLSWDILPGTEQEYFEFLVREFVPELGKLGLQVNEAWLTVYGSLTDPRIMAEAVMPSLKGLNGILHSADWDALTGKLMEYVENFSYKIISAKGGFQL